MRLSNVVIYSIFWSNTKIIRSKIKTTCICMFLSQLIFLNKREETMRFVLRNKMNTFKNH